MIRGSMTVKFWRLAVSLALFLGVFATVALFIENQSLSMRLRQANVDTVTLRSTLKSERELAADEISRLESSINQTMGQYPTSKYISQFQNDVNNRFKIARLDIDRLQRNTKAIQTTISRASQSVVMLQTAYKLIHRESNKPLRHVVIAGTEVPLYLANGTPVLNIDGRGPVFEPVVTGTGFVVAGGRIVTNRHVVNSWETGPLAAFIASPDLEPVRTQLTGYAPDLLDAFELQVNAISSDHDLAVLSTNAVKLEKFALEFGSRTLGPGEPVVVLGYPFGIQAILARAGTEYIDLARSDDISDAWAMAAKLVANGAIRPLASSGIIAQVTGAHVVYDAETASGGSGGPILTLDNKVIAVNSAILPGFGGSNLGIPVEAVSRLLADAD